MFPRDILGGPVVKNLSSNVGDMGSIPGLGTNIPHTIGQLSRHVTTREDCTLQQRVHMLRQRPSTVKKKKNVFFFPRINKYNIYVLNNCRPNTTGFHSLEISY